MQSEPLTTTGRESDGSRRIRQASLADLQRIVIIENDSFTSPWSSWSLRQEIQSEQAVYLVVEVADVVAGYVGMWVAAGEGHVGTLAVAPEYRGRGLGEALMLAVCEQATCRSVDTIVLEYRVSNHPAAALYEKLGFVRTRIRRGYYQDTGEDAVEVILSDLGSPPCQQHLATLRHDWERSHGGSFPGTE